MLKSMKMVKVLSQLTEEYPHGCNVGKYLMVESWYKLWLHFYIQKGKNLRSLIILKEIRRRESISKNASRWDMEWRLKMSEQIKQNWFLLGDIHGSAEPIRYFYYQNRERLSLDDCDNHIILLGDVGCNFALTGQRDYKFKMELSQLPFTYICLRGNHEARVAIVMERNPKRWESVQKYGGEVYVEKEFPMIEYLSDAPAIYDLAGYRTLSFPGAYSIDKWYRLARHWTWYEDEQLTEAEMQSGRELVEREGKIDLVISHTCPLIYEPRDLFLTGIDQSMVDKSMERYLGEIEFDLDYRRWAFGHFHADRLFPWNDGKQMLMLFNENVVDLKKFMEMKEGDSLQEILA